MNTTEIIQILTAFNAWQRGDNSQTVHERNRLGDALDGAVSLLKEYQRLTEQLDSALSFPRASITREDYNEIVSQIKEEVRKC